MAIKITGTGSYIPDLIEKNEDFHQHNFLNADGTYDWTKQEGQVWFAQAAKARGVDKLLLFSNSPSVYHTKNGKAYALDGIPNLEESNFENFAKYLASIIEGINGLGLSVDYISPVNEPQWDWSEKDNGKASQEGTPFFNDDIAKITKI